MEKLPNPHEQLENYEIHEVFRDVFVIAKSILDQLQELEITASAQIHDKKDVVILINEDDSHLSQEQYNRIKEQVAIAGVVVNFNEAGQIIKIGPSEH